MGVGTSMQRLAGCCIAALLLLPGQVFARSDSVRFIPASPLFNTALTVALLQDKDGYLWIMEPWRLYRYDGYRYEFYHSGKGDRSFGEELHFQRLGGGRRNLLCMNATINTLVFLDTGTLQFSTLNLRQRELPEDVRISCVMEDRRGRFWVGTLEGRLIVIQPPAMTITVLSHGSEPEPLLTGAIRTLVDDDSDNVWIGTDRGLLMLPGQGTGERVDLSLMHAVAGMPPGAVSKVTRGADGRIWLCSTEGTIGTISPNDRRFSYVTHLPSPQPGYDIRAFVTDHQANLWVSTPMHGLLRWSASGSGWSHHLSTSEPSGKEVPAIVNDAIVDRDGILWALNASSSLMKYDSRPRLFYAFTPGEGPQPRLSGRDVSTLCVDARGGLWVGRGSGGLDYLEKGSTAFRRFVHDPQDPTSLADNRIVCLRTMHNGTLWIGTFSGISVYDHGSHAFSSFAHDRDDVGSLGHNVVTVLYEDARGTIWVGHYLGLDKFDRATQTFSHVLRWPDETLGLVGSVAAIFEDSQGTLWVGTAGRGLLRISSSGMDTVWFHAGPDSGRGLPENSVKAIYEDSSKRLWFGLGSRGLVQFDRTTGHFDHFPILYSHTAHGIGPGSPPPPRELGVHGILEDSRGYLWLALQGGGIARLDASSGALRRYDETEGIVVVAGRRNAFCLSADGTIYFGGPGGVTWFHPEKIPDDDTVYNPPVVITEFRVNQRVRPISQDSTAPVLLAYSENSCSFEFAMLDYSNPQRYLYQYRLEGLDSAWSYAASDRKVTYVNIPPGTYRFRVRGANASGTWSERQASIPLIVAGPFWRSWWFLLVAILLLSAAAYGAHRMRLARMIALERLRIRIADDLHDDIGSEISALALRSDLVARRLPATSRARGQIHEVGRALREMGNQLRDIVWIMNPDQDKLGDLLFRMRAVTESILANSTFSLVHEELPPEETLDLEFKRHFLLMYKEILHNIAKHSSSTNVDIRVTGPAEALRLIVRDNGTGFQPDAASSGRGLRSLKMRANAIGGSITITSTPGSGTAVCFDGKITRSGD